MKVKLSNGGRAAKKDLALLQAKVGVALSADFLEFVAGNDGAQPEGNIFRIGKSKRSGVNDFIPVNEIPFTRVRDLPARSFPVALAEGGDFVFINLAEGGAVFFWDHERPEKPVKLAKGFREFLELLEPFGAGSN